MTKKLLNTVALNHGIDCLIAEANLLSELEREGNWVLASMFHGGAYMVRIQTTDGVSDRVVINDGLLGDLTADQAVAIILHEIGHVKCSHADWLETKRVKVSNLYNHLEFEADAWAVANGAKPLELANALDKITKRNRDYATVIRPHIEASTGNGWLKKLVMKSLIKLTDFHNHVQLRVRKKRLMKMAINQ